MTLHLTSITVRHPHSRNIDQQV